jgi:uncharacterized membrane protein YccC
LTNAARAAGPPLASGLRLWASVCLALYIAFWLELDNPYWAGTSAAVTCQPHLGASARKGWYRLIGTLVGATVIVVLTALFPQARAPFLLALALWAALCAFVSTLLHNFASYSAALAGYTAAIVAADELGATGGPDADTVFLLAVYRATEICIGIVSVGVVVAGTDFGSARRRLAGLFAGLSAEITGRFTGMLAVAGPDLPDTQPVRRELTRQVSALDPVIDEAIGESSQIRYHSPVLQMAVDGLFAALSGWRAVAIQLARMPDDEARQEADAVLRNIPQELRSAERGVPEEWIADPIRLRRTCETAARTLTTLPARTPSLRLLADQTARALAGISDALNGLALLVTAFARFPALLTSVQIRVPDWLPSFVNAGRAFVAIGIVEIFWIMTEWPNGAFAITFTAIVVLRLAPQAEQINAAPAVLMIAVAVATVLAAVIKFAVLPGLETFEAFCLVIGLYFVPLGALRTLPGPAVVFTALTIFFIPLLAPTNEMTYDPQQFYNAALSIFAGSVAAELSFSLLPPLSPAFRARRLLALTLHDLRRLATGHDSWTLEDWQGRIKGRLVVMPDAAEPLQRSQLLAALVVGSEIIRLRPIAFSLGLGSDLGVALEALARESSAIVATRLARLDDRLATFPVAGPEASLALRGRSSILAISDAINQYAVYFDAGEPG